MKKISEITINPQNGPSYPVIVGKNIIQDSISSWILDTKSVERTFVVICDSLIENLYGREVKSFLEKVVTGKVFLFSFDGGEKNKTRETKKNLENLILSSGCGRDTIVLGLGGGISTDLAGFLAATYMRGVDYLSLPTSLLAMVDATVGGKTGVNTRHGKNLIGCFYQPQEVIVDISFLDTLSLREKKNGFAEMVKHGIIADSEYFSFLREHTEDLFSGEEETLFHSVERSIRIKGAIVEEDTLEKGKRKILNFGHTIGHALEKVGNWTIDHGHAVAYGMVVESWIAEEYGFVDEAFTLEVEQILSSLGLLKKIDRLDHHEMFSSLKMDKKNSHGELIMALPQGFGKMYFGEGAYGKRVKREIVHTSLEKLWKHCLSW